MTRKLKQPILNLAEIPIVAMALIVRFGSFPRQPHQKSTTLSSQSSSSAQQCLETMSTRYAILQTAVFERFANGASWESISCKHSISSTTLRRTYAQWARNYLASPPTSERDIHLSMFRLGRRPALTENEEEIIAKSVLYFAANNIPLSRHGVRDLVQEFVSLLPEYRQKAIPFFDNRPSNRWVTLFARRNGLDITPVQLMEDKRLKAATAENLTQHIARVEAALKRFNINDPPFIFNTDQSGVSFSKMKGRSLRKGVGKKGVLLLQTALTTQGNIHRVTVMSVVSASGTAYKPAIVFPGVLAHYRKVQGVIQSLHTVLPPCYLFQRNPAGVDTDIIYQWAQQFITETEHLRAGNKKLLLLLDGYGSHIQYKTLKLFRENNVIVIALPAHTSHITQPLDVSVFSPFKSFLQLELHKAARQKRELNAFDIGQCVSNAYSSSYTATNIRSGFHKTGIWDLELARPSFEPLRRHIFITENEEVSEVSVDDLLESLKRQHRTLLRDVLVEESGNIKVSTTSGAHLTLEAVLAALLKRVDEKRKKAEREKRKRLSAAYTEPKADLQRLINLALERTIRRKKMVQLRVFRRDVLREKARVLGAAERAAALEAVAGPILPDSDDEGPFEVM